MKAPKELDSWFNVNNTFPNEDTYVLVFVLTDSGGMWKISRCDKDLCWKDENDVPIKGRITHWMPLPEFPRRTR